MPIRYSVSHDGHFIHAVASGIVTCQQFVEYEVAHPVDERIKPPVSKLLEIEHGAFRRITMEDMSKVLEQRKEVKTRPTPHRCAIVVSLDDNHAWDLAKFYELMVMLHLPETVIVFGDTGRARTWLGVDNDQPNKPDADEGK